jgi:hypothetical protein
MGKDPKHPSGLFAAFLQSVPLSMAHSSPGLYDHRQLFELFLAIFSHFSCTFNAN